MEQPSTSRPKLVPKRFGTATNRKHLQNNNKDTFDSKRGLKRRNDSEIIFGTKRPCSTQVTETTTSSNHCGSRQKFSANARLMQYRKTLETKRNETVKVHTLQKASDGGPVNQIKESCSESGLVITPTTNKSPISISVNYNNVNNKSISDRLKKYKKESAFEETTQNTDCLRNDDCEMDWSPINEEQLLSDINNIRQNFNEILSHKSSFQEIMSDKIPSNNYVFKDTFIVIDTNIFLSHLNIVRHLLNIKLNGVYRPFVLIPWVVIQELDYMKDGRDGRRILEANARKAVDFINKSLLADNTTLKGQSVIDASESTIPCQNLDDGILACCMQVVERGNRAILLSNDKNLCNKALIHSIPAYSSETIFKELEISSPSQQKLNPSKSEEIKNHLTALFNTIIHGEALIAYGEYYYKMGVFKGAPWNLEKCLEKFEKLWIAVFSEKLPKQFLQSVDELQKFLSNHKSVNSEADHEQLIKCSLNVCLYLKNSLNDYYKLISDCINRIVKLT